MRVAYICADPGIPVWGSKGASAHVRAVVRALRRRGTDVTVFTPRTGGSPPQDLADLEVVELPNIDGGPPAQREWAAVEGNGVLRAALDARDRFDLVYERYSLWSFAGMSYARAHDVRGLLEVNAPLVDEQARHRVLHDRRTAERIARCVLELADGVVAVSEPVAGWARSLGAGSVAVIPNGVDVERFAAAAAEHGRSRTDEFTVAFVGSLKRWHGVETLVEAVGLLVADGDAVGTRLLLVGDGPQRTAIESLVDRVGLRGVTTMTGAVDPDAVPGWLAAADVGVAPYPADAEAYFSPLKVLDYLAAGLAVVASAVGQVPAMLDDEQAGILTAPGDPHDLAGALRRLRDAPALRRQLGAHGRALAVSRHSWDDVVGRSLATVGLDNPARALVGGPAR